jgi:hypothetical protein
MDGKAMPISRKQLVEELMPGLERLFGTAYGQHKATEYRMKSRYGKYSIYRWDYEATKRTSTTLAKGLDKETAEGMMKLLKEPK